MVIDLDSKPQHLLQDYRCPGSCKRELYEGDTCYHGTCEYNRNDPIYKKEESISKDTSKS